MMDIVRSVAVFALVAFLVGAMGRPAFAAPPGQGFYSSDDSHARDRGTISGQVLGVDYGRGQLIVANARGRIAILVLPSTTIFRGRDYATLTDLTNGMHVQIEASEIDGRLIAQIIRIL